MRIGPDLEPLLAGVRAEFPLAELVADDEALADVARALAALAVGHPAPQLPLDLRGTAFQARVWQALTRIPAGETRTYAEVAAEIGRPVGGARGGRRVRGQPCGARRAVPSRGAHGRRARRLPLGPDRQADAAGRRAASGDRRGRGGQPAAGRGERARAGDRRRPARPGCPRTWPTRSSGGRRSGSCGPGSPRSGPSRSRSSGSRVGAVALGILAAVTRTALPRRADLWRHVVVYAALQNAVPLTLFAFGQQLVPSVLAAIINAATPLTTLVVIIAAFPEEHPTPRRVAGLLTGFVGILVVIGVWRSFPAAQWQGVLACLGAITCYGLAFPYARRHIVGAPEGAAGRSPPRRSAPVRCCCFPWCSPPASRRTVRSRPRWWARCSPSARSARGWPSCGTCGSSGWSARRRRAP